MKRLLISCAIAILLQGSLVSQEGRVRIRFIDNSVREGTMTACDQSGIMFKAEGTSIAIKFRWDELEAEDAERLQAAYLGKKIVGDVPQPTELTFPAVKIVTKGGETIEGIVAQAGAEDILIKNAQRSKFIRRADILSEEKVVLPWHKLFTPEELTKQLVEKAGALDTPEKYEELGRLLIQHGLPDRAKEQFVIARLLRHPEIPENKFYKDLQRLQVKLDDLTLNDMVYNARELYVKNRYDDILRLFDRIEERMTHVVVPQDLVDEVKRLRIEISVLREVSLDQKIVSEWRRLVDVAILAKACDKGVSLADAVQYVTEVLTEEVSRSVGKTFNISPDDPTPAIVWGKRPTSIQEKLSYDEASWIVERPDFGNKEAWWMSADNNARYKLLRGIYAEKAMYIIKVFEKNCPHCGGSGAQNVDLLSPSQCQYCMGLKHFRCLIYR